MVERAKPAKVSKALRFQILRRDNHTCRYCGASAPTATLTVDHVMPQALGGTTVPENLVTACEPCNSGKSATPPDANHIADVRADALRWRQAMSYAADIQVSNEAKRDDYIEEFDETWSGWSVDGKPIPRDEQWRESIGRFCDLGMELSTLLSMVDRTMAKSLRTDQRWKYFCGCCWHSMRERVEIAREILDGGDA
jgi:hypothetical protein